MTAAVAHKDWLDQKVDNFTHGWELLRGAPKDLPVALSLHRRLYRVKLHAFLYTAENMLGAKSEYKIVQSEVMFGWFPRKHTRTYDKDTWDAVTRTNKTVTPRILLEHFEYVLAFDHEEDEDALRRTRALARKAGTVMLADNEALEYRWMFGQALARTHVLAKKRVIVDADMETEAEEKAEKSWTRWTAREYQTIMPFVRVFLVAERVYAFVDVRDLTPVTWIEDAAQHLQLPSRHRRLLTTLLSAKREKVFADLFSGRSGGIVIMAAGSPGTGKTLTAEVMAEDMKRILYVVKMADLSLDAETAEKELDLIFRRVRRWNCIPLLDECEMMLRQRSAQDREQAALVSVFLRVMDSYDGTLFLTTNFASVIDTAIMSRVTLVLHYEDLTPQTRLNLWLKMLEKAGVAVAVDALKPVVAMKMNGRQIRSAVRLASLLAQDGKIDRTDLVEIARDVCRGSGKG